MPVRNLWSLEPGECLVAERIFEELEGCEVYFPLRDVGVDLLIVKGSGHVGVQVKESRYYYTVRWRSVDPRGHVGHSWHRVSREKFQKSLDRVGFYIFVTYVHRLEESREKTRTSFFETKFLVVPTRELEKRMEIKRPVKGGVYSFCFHFEDGKAWDEDVNIQDESMKPLAGYSQYIDVWHLLSEALG
ncbi:MAG: hypothetical protein QXR45_15355 [Candidatus Bathyarchaeia archaeon]